MPELPEVETVRKTLKVLASDKQIENVTVHWPKIIKNPVEVEQFIDALKGETIEDVGRRGKFLIIYTTTFALVSHLRMEGKYGLYPREFGMISILMLFFILPMEVSYGIGMCVNLERCTYLKKVRNFKSLRLLT